MSRTINPFKDKNMDMDTMINFSGGIDSVYVAWKYLVENPKKKLLIHHVILKTKERRWNNEKKAVDSVLKWFKKNGLDNFEYVETGIDVSKCTPKLYDSAYTSFMQIAILRDRKYKGVVNVLNNSPRDEYLRIGEPELDRRASITKQMRIATNTDYINIIPVVKDMYKKDIIKDMPKDLLKLCWYCRRPRPDGSVCHECHTCKQVEKVLDEIKRGI